MSLGVLLGLAAGHLPARAGQAEDELKRWAAFTAKTFPRYTRQKASIQRDQNASFCVAAPAAEKLEASIFEPWRIRIQLKRHGPLVYVSIQRRLPDARSDIHHLLQKAGAKGEPNPCLYKGNHAFVPWGDHVVTLGVSCAGNRRFPRMLRRLLEGLRALDPLIPLPGRVIVSHCGHMRYATRTLESILDPENE